MTAKPKRSCHKENRKGGPCGAPVIKGSDPPVCISHADEETKRSAGFGGAQPGSGRPALPKPTEIMRRLVEQHVEAVIGPHFRTLGFEVVRDANGELSIQASENGGAKVFGESKEGVVRISEYDDLGAHIAAAEKLLDRVYGRPKQTTELTGEGGGPVELVPVAMDRKASVVGVLAGAGAVKA